MRRTKASLIYRRTTNLRAVQPLLGHTKLESTVRYLGIEVDDALAMAEQTEVEERRAGQRRLGVAGRRPVRSGPSKTPDELPQSGHFRQCPSMNPNASGHHSDTPSQAKLCPCIPPRPPP